jgi:hypothetical protein
MREDIKILLEGSELEEWVMKHRIKKTSVEEDLNKTQLDPSDAKRRAKFSMQLGIEPYIQLGTGRRCKVKDCVQPVYGKRSRLCRYHRMKKVQLAFDNGLRVQQQSKNQRTRA